MIGVKCLMRAVTARRNQSIECCRLIASIFIVFIHYPFPGTIGAAVECIARFAVPFFFAVSGYFAFWSGTEKLGKRLLGIVKLNAVATGFYILWKTVYVCLIQHQNWLQWFKSTLSLKNILAWILIQVNPFSSQLWYLSALIVCYIAVYVYTKRFQDNGKICYKNLYRLGAVLLLIHLLMGPVASVFGIDIHYKLYRNGYLFGLPMFILGLYLREHHKRIMSGCDWSDSKLCMIVMAGVCLTVLQRFTIGKDELPVGCLLIVTALILLFTEKATVTENRRIAGIIAGFGSISTCVYVTHMFWGELYAVVLQEQMTLLLGEAHQAYFMPAGVAVMSLLFGIVWGIVVMRMRNGFCKHR